MSRGDIAPDRTSPMEDGVDGLYREAHKIANAAPGADEDEAAPDYLALLKDAERRGVQYFVENLQSPIDAAYRAFRNKHFAGSKYWHNDYRNRSKLFRPKTRTAVRKAGAQAVSALFASKDAVKCSAGDESDQMQRANAALTQELFNYRTNRSSGIAALPWFRICGGAHQDAMLQSACVSKQSWKLELRPKLEPQIDPATNQQVIGDDGQPVMDEVHRKFIDRPDCQLIPLENVNIDPAASWLNPIQSAAFFRVKYPMSVDEVMQMQKHPLNPWKAIDEAQLRGSATTSEQSARDVRQQREGGTDRLDARFSGTRSFEIVWVFEIFIRWRGEDIHFWSVGDKAFLTDPKPVEEVYPEQGGERPYTFGVINLESHRLFPMSPVESWQQGQIEINDFANLILDTAKLTVSPVRKVVKGAGVDLAALTRAGPNSQILVTRPEDVTWDKPPEPGAAALQIVDRLNVDFDDQAGQFNSGSVQTNRSLNETVGGLKLISGSANAVGEFDLRVWIETWVEPTVAQIVKCIQYYENDATILALCGTKAKLFEKFGVNEINDQLLQSQVKVGIDAGIGNADPDQKLAKLGNALTIMVPMMEKDPKILSGQIVIKTEEIYGEVFSLCGYSDPDRFITVNEQPPQQNDPRAGAEAAKMQGEAADKHASANLKTVQAQRLQAEIPNVQAQAPKTIAETQKLLAETHATKTDTLATAVGVHHAHHDQQFQHDLQQDDQMHRQGLERADHVHGQTMDRAGFARELTGDHRAATEGEHSRDMAERQFAASREDAAASREDAAEDRKIAARKATPK